MGHFKEILILGMTFLFNLLFFFVLWIVKDKRKSRVFSLFVLSLMLWSCGVAMFYSASTPGRELFWAKFLFLTSGLIPPSFLYYSLVFKDTNTIGRRAVFYIFSPGLLLAYLYFFTPLMIVDIPHFRGIKTFQFGPAHFIWETLVIVMFAQGVLHFLRLYKISSGTEKEHIKYILTGILLGFGGGSVTNMILPRLGICDFVWLGPLLVSTCLFLVIIRLLTHKIVEIRLALSNFLLFVSIYAFVIGVPFYIYAFGHHLLALIFMLVLASSGYGLYDFLRKHLERKILEDQIRYQNELLQASERISRLKSIDEITRAIVKTICETVGLKNISFYMVYEGILKLNNSAGNPVNEPEEIPLDQENMDILSSWGVIPAGGIDYQKYPALAKLKTVPGSLFVPIVHNKKLSGLLVLGEKADGTSFLSSDIKVLSLVANNIALVIRNTQYREEEFERLKKEDALSRREFLDNIVSVMSHEIRNPNGVVLGQAEILHDYFSERLGGPAPDPSAERAVKALKTIADHSEKINILLEKIRRYSQEHEIHVATLSLPALLENIDIFEHAILKKYPNVCFKKEIAASLPPVLGDEILVEEILINYLSNAAHAAAHGPNQQGTVVLSVERFNEKFVRCMVRDDGYGISPEVLKKLFHVPTTTKSNSEGTGLGLWNIRKIAEMIGGHFGIDSPGAGQGARAWLDLRIAAV